MGEKEGTIYIFKTHPRSNRAAPPYPVQKLRQQSSYCTPTPCIILGGETAADVKGGFFGFAYNIQ
jgi:hypothetical protein